jgi:secreted PhoX family phosphatase
VFTADHPASSSGAANAPAGEFNSPDNLALDRKGNLAITEDPSTNTVGADIWVAAPSSRGRHQPASTVARFASLVDCEAEPTGIYFALKAPSATRPG